MSKAKVTSKGQITIPKEIREKLDLNPGDNVFLEETEKGDIKMSVQKKSILDLRGILHRPGQKPKSVQEMNEGVTEYLKKKYKK